MYTPGGQKARLYVFEAGNGDPIVEYDLPDPAGNAAATAISAGGEYVAVAAWPNVYVYDVYGQTLRWSGSLPAGNDALAISGDGRYLGWGWTTFYFREWTGSSYDLLWSHSPGSGYYVGQCALTNAGDALAVAWDNGSTYPNEITLDIYDLPSLDLRWSYEYAAPPGAAPVPQHVDIPSQMCFSPDGERLAVSSWGGSFPEIHVFDTASPEPLYMLDTPGSMFDIDVITTGAGTTYVTACGKNVHAGQSGRGGDLYAIRLPAE
jgi:WD40 repeat protein